LTDNGELSFELRPAAGEPHGALVLLHGRGTDQHDLLSLAELLDPAHRLAAITPAGPLSLPPGGRHWYVVERVGHPDPESFKATYDILDRWLTGLAEMTGVPWEKTVLGGFSQGAVMAYALGLGRGRPSPAAIIALSGFIASVPGFEIQSQGREQMPVAIGHGSLDPVISVRFAHEANRRLTAAGLDVTFRESPIAHGIDPAFAGDLEPWIERAVTAEPTGNPASAVQAI
jgi:phospholipase/carboxylesterase